MNKVITSPAKKPPLLRKGMLPKIDWEEFDGRMYQMINLHRKGLKVIIPDRQKWHEWVVFNAALYLCVSRCRELPATYKRQLRRVPRIVTQKSLMEWRKKFHHWEREIVSKVHQSTVFKIIETARGVANTYSAKIEWEVKKV